MAGRKVKLAVVLLTKTILINGTLGTDAEQETLTQGRTTGANCQTKLMQFNWQQWHLTCSVPYLYSWSPDILKQCIHCDLQILMIWVILQMAVTFFWNQNSCFLQALQRLPRLLIALQCIALVTFLFPCPRHFPWWLLSQNDSPRQSHKLCPQFYPCPAIFDSERSLLS